MKNIYYERLGLKMIAYVNSDKFTPQELGETFERIYTKLLREEERDLRDEANGKIAKNDTVTNNN